MLILTNIPILDMALDMLLDDACSAFGQMVVDFVKL